ncbi:MAG: ATP-binding protein [Clostridium botulinum]|uniref:ATP-binding protein n=1 Tax=uncultured Clostridium sp. TaxID=59620 RepID=UPI00280C0337|nr:ATP-binding protein [uncultured Clostridium sp.]MDU6878934.1 ATP-binding protein [Clostridium botulinum]
MQDLIHNAEYKEQIISEYKGNPFIEALPEITSSDEIVSRLAGFPPYDKDERLLDSQYRTHLVGRLYDVFQPLMIHLDLESRISRVVRQGYIGRNILDKSFVSNHYRSTAGSFTLLGVSGMGKTTVVNRILAMYPQVIVHSKYKDRELSRYQVVFLRLECSYDGSIKGLCLSFFSKIDELLETDYYSRFGSGKLSVDNMLVAMSNIAKNISLGLLVIDEIQNLSKSKSGGADRMLNFFVTLVNTIGLPVLLIGTPEAMGVLQGKFRQARRGSGQGDLVFERLDNDINFKLLINAIWGYQWTKKPTALTDELIDTLYDQSQGIIDITVKLYALAQTKAISSGKETITPELIKQVADESLRLVKPMLNALRTGNVREMAKYPDIYTGNIDLNYEESLKDKFVIPTITKPSVVESDEKPVKIKQKKVSPSKEDDIRVIVQNDVGKGLTTYEILKNYGIIKGFEVV